MSDIRDGVKVRHVSHSFKLQRTWFPLAVSCALLAFSSQLALAQPQTPSSVMAEPNGKASISLGIDVLSLIDYAASLHGEIMNADRTFSLEASALVAVGFSHFRAGVAIRRGAEPIDLWADARVGYGSAPQGFGSAPFTSLSVQAGLRAYLPFSLFADVGVGFLWFSRMGLGPSFRLVVGTLL